MKLGELYQISTDYILFGDSPQADVSVSETHSQESLKDEPSQKQPVNGIIWFGLGVLAILILYYATNGF